jgi:peroxiredoxin Q/BCP
MPVSLADYAGRKVLIWFFPRAYGKGCTLQAASFRDHMPDFAGTDTVVLGITTSSSDDLRSWSQEIGLTTELLSDADHAVSSAYGAFEDPDQERPKRVSILIGSDGKVAKTYRVEDAPGHPATALKDLSHIA